MDRAREIESLFTSLNALKRIVYSNSDYYLRQNGISFSQMMVLKVIKEHEGIGVKEISDILRTSSSATTQSVNILVEKGYVLREHELRDHRAVRIVLSEDGSRQLDSLKTQTMENLFDMFTDEELYSYSATIKEFIKRIQEERKDIQ